MALLLTLCLLLLILPFHHRHASASDEEIRSLLEFRKGIKSDPSNQILSTWIYPPNGPAACPASFHGVVCDPSASSVVSISLDRLGLSGDLKFSTLIPLKSLQNLTLAGNSLTGRVVPMLGVMSSLQVIDLSGNQFYGPIPSRLTDLWALHYVNLSSNNFSGFLPAGMEKLQQMRVLDLHSNQLEGDVAELIPKLRNVEYLDLSGNVFSGSVGSLSVEHVSSLANTVMYVDLSGNGLGGGFWGSDVMNLFRNLRVLDLGDNAIEGELPDLGRLPNLQVLRLGGNRFSGSVQDGFLQGEVPLVELDLSGNGFSGPIPQINSTRLATLNLSSNRFSGSLPSSIGNCHIVDLSKNGLSGDITVLKNWNPDLEILDLTSNALTGIIPDLSQFQKLISISVQNNSLKGNLPLAFSSLQKLITVDLSSNRIDGPIPHNIFTSMTIINLNLSGNLLTGSIPLDGSHTSELLVLSSSPPMESLDLSSNLLTGGLPSGIGTWVRLKLLNLASNNLSGHLPNELSRLTALEYLDLSHNHFDGNIPDKLPSSLKFLDVAFNNLVGEIPKSLNYFPDSSFSGNNLEPRRDNPNRVPEQIQDSGKNHHRGSKSSIRVAIILASIGAAVMIAFVIFAYRRARFHDFPVRGGFCGPAAASDGRDIKSGRFLSFSNDNLLTSSNSRSLPEQIDSADASAGPMNQDSNHPVEASSSSRFSDTLEPIMLDVCSPDRFVGELFFLDTSLVFSAEELSRAPAEVLGRSSHGTLYKATLGNGHMLTVKWLRVGLVKQKKDFAKEAKKIGAIKHQSVVPSRAYYWGPREQERLIISDYIVGDSLALHLYETTPSRYKPLSFTQRLKVATDIAYALMFLHDKSLPHGNLKPTNILLVGPEPNVRLTDYGLHRLMTPAGVAEQILNLGALGYRAPELENVSKPFPSFKADVYAFGVILMELLTRRSAGDIISGHSGSVDLTDWVRLCHREGRGMGCVDRDIAGGEEDSTGMDELLGISIRCVLPANERPNIRQVFDDIRSISV